MNKTVNLLLIGAAALAASFATTGAAHAKPPLPVELPADWESHSLAHNLAPQNGDLKECRDADNRIVGASFLQLEMRRELKRLPDDDPIQRRLSQIIAANSVLIDAAAAATDEMCRRHTSEKPAPAAP
jgi:hypothetical protein